MADSVAAFQRHGIHEVTGSIPVWSTIPKSLILNDQNR